MKFLKPILSAKAPGVVIYFGTLLTLLALGANFLFPEFLRNFDNQTILIQGSVGANSKEALFAEGQITAGRINTAVKAIGLTLLASILYLKLLELSPTLADRIKQAGINGVLDDLNSDALRQMMSPPGDKHILDTWLSNFSEIEPSLLKALDDTSTQVYITILDPASIYVARRVEELPCIEKDRPISSFKLVQSFYVSLNDDTKRKRIRVFYFDEMPKFSVFASTDSALVGVFLPGLNSNHGTHFVVDGRFFIDPKSLTDSPKPTIQGRKVNFSQAIREWYCNLKRTEITIELEKAYDLLNSRTQEQPKKCLTNAQRAVGWGEERTPTFLRSSIARQTHQQCLKKLR